MPLIGAELLKYAKTNHLSELYFCVGEVDQYARLHDLFRQMKTPQGHAFLKSAGSKAKISSNRELPF
jgi:hypothetical protein